MNQSDNTLYSFLKKNAAFSTGGRSSQKQSDFDSIKASKGQNYVQSSSLNYSNDQFSGSSRQDNNFNDKNSMYTFGGGPRERGYRGNQPESRAPIRIQNQSQSNRSMQSGFSNRTTSSNFESARNQAIQVLDNLSVDMRKQISNIDYKLESFNKNILRDLKEHTENFKRQVIWMIDEAFRQNQKHLYEIQRTQEQKFAGELLQIKSILQSQFVKVEVMRGQITQPNWKKVAGEILSSQLEDKVLNLIDRSDRIQILCPDWNQKTASSLRQIQQLVRQSVRLK